MIVAKDVVVGFVGLGTMGGKMATNLLKAGYKVVVHDLHRQAASHHLQEGAEWADTPRALAERSDVILSSLPEPADVERVALGADGLIEGVKKGAAYFDLSTNSQSVVKKISAAFAAKGADMLDAPVSGGPSGAASRKMAIWVGGDKAAFDKHKAVLDAMGDRAAYIGPIGTATVAKLVHNMSSYAVTAALAETFTMGVKAGVDPVALWEAVRQGVSGRRLTFDGLLEQFLPGKYDPPNFALKTRDQGCHAGDRARDANSACRCASAISRTPRWWRPCNRGWEGRDSRVMMLLQEERAGVKIAVRSGADQTGGGTRQGRRRLTFQERTMPSFSLAALTALELAPAELIDVAAACGYEHVGLRLMPAVVGGPAYPLMDDPAKLKETIARSAATGVTVADIEIAALRADTDIASFQSLFEAGARLGAKHILVAAYDPDLRRFADNYRAVLRGGAALWLDRRSRIHAVDGGAEPQGSDADCR